MKIEKIDVSELNDILSLELEFLKEPELCLMSTTKDVEKCLKHYSIGVFDDNGKLAAYTLCWFTEYGTAYIEKCFVRPDYRGNNYQLSMLDSLLYILRRLNIKVVYSMVSPRNETSMLNFDKAGFVYHHSTECCTRNRIVIKKEL